MFSSGNMGGRYPKRPLIAGSQTLFSISHFRLQCLSMHTSIVVEPGSGRCLSSSNLGMNHSRNTSSGRSTDSSKGCNTGSSRVFDTCSLGNIDTGKYRDSYSIGMDKGMSMNTAMDMNIHNPVHNSVRNSVHNSVRNPHRQPMKCKASRGQEVPYLV